MRARCTPHSERFARATPSTARCERPRPDQSQEADVQHDHTDGRDEQIGGERNLEAVHCHEAQCLYGGAWDTLPPSEDPEAEQHFADADEVGGEIRVRFSEDARNDGAMAWNPAQQFAVESVEDPDGADEDLGGEEHA
jgi:hypothetical protein